MAVDELPDVPLAEATTEDLLAALTLRLEAKDEAVRIWAHDLLGGLQVMESTAELVQRYVERGDTERANAKARALVALAKDRALAIKRGREMVLKA
jgi:hypothetical protein